jgi:hypothetical protein
MDLLFAMRQVPEVCQLCCAVQVQVLNKGEYAEIQAADLHGPKASGLSPSL